MHSKLIFHQREEEEEEENRKRYIQFKNKIPKINSPLVSYYTHLYVREANKYFLRTNIYTHDFLNSFSNWNERTGEERNGPRTRKKPIKRGEEAQFPFSKAMRDDFHAEIRLERAGIEKQASRQSRQSILTRNPR